MMTPSPRPGNGNPGNPHLPCTGRLQANASWFRTAILRAWPILTALLWAGCSGTPSSSQAPLPELPSPTTGPEPQAGEEAPLRRLTLALTAEVRGEIEPCGCPTMPIGGFQRRAGLLESLSGEEAPLLHLDAGHLLVSGFSTGGRGEPRERAELLLELSEEVGLDAWVPGPGDLAALDLDSLKEAVARRSFATISATWVDQRTGELAFPPAQVLTTQGLEVGVIGLSRAPEAAQGTGLETMDPVEAALSALETLPPDLDLVVAVSNLRDDENDRVASSVEGLAVLLSTRNQAYDEPRRKGSGLVVEVPDRGRYVAVLRCRLGSTGGQTLDLETARRLSLPQRDRLTRQLARLESEEPEEGSPSLRVIQEGKEQLDLLDGALSDGGAGRNLAYLDLVPLTARHRGAQEITERIASFHGDVLETVARRLEEQRHSPDAPPSYTSGAPCLPCHTQQFTRWTLTAHAKAWQTLVDRQANQRPECVTCHTTGFAVTGGWADLDPANIRKYKAVQCEACHGPASRHLVDPSEKPAMPTEATCLRCHDEDNSPEFNYGEYLPRAACVEIPSPASKSSAEDAD